MIPPLRVLALVASPNELRAPHRDLVARNLSEALRPLIDRGDMVLERVVPATENALKRALDESPWNVLHFIGHAQVRTAQYQTMSLEASDGRTRGLTLGYLARLVLAYPSLRLVTLQPIADLAVDFAPIATTLVELGVPSAIATSPLSDRRQAVFLSKLYAAICASGEVEAATTEARFAIEAIETGACRASLARREPHRPLFSLGASTPPAATSTDPPQLEPSDAAAAEAIARKRAACSFDVFLCHNSADKPAVKRIGERLKQRGVLPWLDEWELRPGQAWQPVLEEQIGWIRAAAVFVGAAGFGPWHKQEAYALLREFVERGSDVIPVLLDDAPSDPELPRFLRGNMRVDFRKREPDPLDQLIWGITRVRPGG
ncbi:MAG TPA: TIR domain-containing protein [Acetobacteraceae bacterium]|nr:TIR domain-containing protein [Acetobacteraceae bacterium]